MVEGLQFWVGKKRIGYEREQSWAILVKKRKRRVGCHKVKGNLKERGKRKERKKKGGKEKEKGGVFCFGRSVGEGMFFLLICSSLSLHFVSKVGKLVPNSNIPFLLEHPCCNYTLLYFINEVYSKINMTRSLPFNVWYVVLMCHTPNSGCDRPETNIHLCLRSLELLVTY